MMSFNENEIHHGIFKTSLARPKKFIFVILLASEFISLSLSHHNYDFSRLPSAGILLVPMMAPRSARVFSTLTGSSALSNGCND